MPRTGRGWRRRELPAPPPNPDACPVCSARGTTFTPVLWPGLIEEWGLSPTEAASVDRQQGQTCSGCGQSLRGQVLAQALLEIVGHPGPLDAWIATAPPARLLEINEAAQLSPRLATLPGHRLVTFPEVDMEQLPYGDGTWDVVVHSDTLEHVGDPVQALRECRRVLCPGGWLVCTVPVIPGRLTRRRDDLPASYHGLEHDPIYLVVTEYGADAWTQLLAAGFTSLRMVTRAFPDGLAFAAQR